MRPYTMRMTPPFTMIGSSVAEVEESKHPSYPKGSTIIIYAGWVERGYVNPKQGKLWWYQELQELWVAWLDKLLRSKDVRLLDMQELMRSASG